MGRASASSVSPNDNPCETYSKNFQQQYFGFAHTWMAEQDGTIAYNNCSFGRVTAQNCTRHNYAYAATPTVTLCNGVGSNTAEQDWTLSGVAGTQSYGQSISTDIFGNFSYTTY